jgi:hypothetical protein
MALNNKIIKDKKNADGELEFPFFNAYQNYIENHNCGDQSAQECGRKYSIINKSKKEIVKYKIDGGLINNNDEIRCDYGFYTEDKFLFLVELKGRDYSQAIDQIINTISLLIEKPKIKVSKINARIVASKLSSPELRSSNEKKLKRLLDSYCFDKDNLKKQSQQMTEIL